MICPGCQTRLPDDAVICESCNLILDTSFLGENITNQRAGEPAAPGPEPARVAADFEEQEEPAGNRPGVLDRMAAPPVSVAEAIDDLSGAFQSFPRSEQLTTASAAVFLVSLGLPWLWNDVDETLIGLFTSVWPLGLFAAGVCAAGFLRRRPRLRAYAEQFLLAALIGSLVIVCWTAVFVWQSGVRAPIYMAGKPPVEEWKATPEFGAFVGVLAGVLMLIGASLTYRGWVSPRR